MGWAVGGIIPPPFHPKYPPSNGTYARAHARKPTSFRASLFWGAALEGGRDGAGYRGLVSVELRLVGAFHRHSEIVGLLLAQGSQPGVEGVQVESGHLLV